MANSYVAEAERVSADRHARDSAWLNAARRNAIEQFGRRGFPTTHDEEWRFTSVAPIANGRFVLAKNGVSSLSAHDLAPFDWHGDVATLLVFVNGRCAAAGVTPRGANVVSLGRALADGSSIVEEHLTRIADAARDPFTALNTAFLSDGALIHVPDNVVVESPIHVLFLSIGEPEPAMAHPRALIVLGTNAHATIVESYGSARADGYFTNAVTEIVAGANSTVQHYKVQRESASAYHVGSLYVEAARDATVASHSVALGGGLVRNDITVVLDGEGAGCTLNGVYVGDGERLVDNHTTIDHAKPHCASRELYKGVLADRARAVFNGKIIVRPDAQKTDAKQTSKALLLSEHAQINTKPQLEIFANDVKCTHGAAVGQMDEEAIFYLRARGLSEAQARHMLIRAFAGDVLQYMTVEPLRSLVEAEFIRRIPGAAA
jgi:Fe-S cluster assembly protein SufD